MGRGMIWPFGGEYWCNLEGKYLHIVSDMSAFAGQEYETSICTLGVMGTRYVRDGTPLPAQIDIVAGQSWSFSLSHIYSELEIGTTLAIKLREKTQSELVTIID